MDRDRHDREFGRPQHHDRLLRPAGRLLREFAEKLSALRANLRLSSPERNSHESGFERRTLAADSGSVHPLKKLGCSAIIIPYGVEEFATLKVAESVFAIITFAFGYTFVIYCVKTFAFAVSGEVTNVINVFGIFAVLAAACDCVIALPVLVSKF